MCKDCQCSNIKCNGALVANLDSFVRERKIDVSVFARIRNHPSSSLQNRSNVAGERVDYSLSGVAGTGR